ncbi:MAG: hypothetical protein K0S71_779 [Clostridia bacterium]|jgi:hypothetical protein|nr:hypothetical protein [Clostridia bacterium]
MIKNFFKCLRPKWEEVLFTQDIDYYLKLKARLLEKGIQHRTKIHSRSYGMNRDTYTILVKAEEIYKARQMSFRDKGENE